MSTSELQDEKEVLSEIAASNDDKGVLDQDSYEDNDDEDGDRTKTYEINSYGADFDVDGIVRRMDRGEIYVPPFQRRFVWKQNDASRFVESLLLGFPVPAIFLSKEADGRFLIVDGQQRLETLRSYRLGTLFGHPFKLVGIPSRFAGKTYNELSGEDQRRLDNSLIHTIIVQPTKPEEPGGQLHSSIYLLFDRLNSGGRPLFPQEIRACVDHGPFIDLLGKLNQNGYWRELYGGSSRRLKDEELILRFLALYLEGGTYEAPMKSFLNDFCTKYRKLPGNTASIFRNAFEEMVQFTHAALGKNAFRPITAFNAAFYDAISVAIALRLDLGPVKGAEELKKAYEALREDANFIAAYSQTTSRQEQVFARLEIALSYFSSVP
jgi:hypothetical protein